MNERTEVTDRRRAPGGQRPRSGAGTRTAARTGGPAEARTSAGTRPGGRGAIRAPARAPGRPPAARPAAAPPVPDQGAAGYRPVAPGADRAAPARKGGPAPESRTRFVFLVVALLGGGLLCLLMVNTILATGAFRITALQEGNVALTQRVQTLQAQIAAEEAPSALARRAQALGMVAPPLAHYLDLRTGKIVSQPRQVPGVPTVPGYVP